MKVFSIGDQIRRGTYTVRSRFTRSVLLLGAKDCALFIVDRSIGAGPLNLVVSNPNTFVWDERLDIPLPEPAPLFDSTLPRLHPGEIEKLLCILRSSLPRQAPSESLVSLFAPAQALPKTQHFRDVLFQKAFAHIAARRIAEGARLIRGCGEGLTPSGDDFLCGWMLACRLQRKIALAKFLMQKALGKNPISNAFLKMAATGRVNGAMQHLIQSPTDARVKKVCAFGHNSGADVLCGMVFGLSRP